MDNLNIEVQESQVQGDNLNLIYSYTEGFLKTRTDNITRIETRLATILAFTGVAIKLVVDLPTTGYTQIFRVASLMVLTIGVVIVGTALRSRRVTGYVTPQELVDDWYAAPEPDLKGFIAKGWLEIEPAIEAMGQRKAKALNWAIACLMAGGIGYAIGAAILG